MKIMLVTTPIRPVPTTYPPFGCLTLMTYLRKNGVDGVEFYNIDGNRPDYDEVLAHIRAAKPDVLGISAVVSTAYGYTKRLSLDVKKMLPDTLIVVGGNLAASAEVLLRRTGIDICVLGEGEKIFLNVVRQAEKSKKPEDFALIPGLMLLRGDELLNTGFDTGLANTEIYDVDWNDLAATSPIEHFIYDPLADDGTMSMLGHDARLYEPERVGKTVVTLHASKGCVAKCTFCHRWDKGIRYIPVDMIMGRLEELFEKYNIGFLIVADENFGTDRKWLREFCEKIKPYDILWRVVGMRVNCISPEFIEMMRDAGCVTVVYGMETGSERMLEIMEKKVKLVDNYNAMRWTIEAGPYTIIQLVLGMPGETPDTVRETIEFCKFGMTQSANQNPNDLSINYAQALPGTPLYEFARHKGLIGADLDGEEEYLLRISDSDAHDEVTTLNFTDYPSLVCQTWRSRIQIETNFHYVAKFGIAHYRKILLNDANYFRRPREESGYVANPKRLIDKSLVSSSVHDVKATFDIDTDERMPSWWSLVRSGNFGLALICYPVLAYRLRGLLLLMVLFRGWRFNGAAYAFGLIREYLGYCLSALKGKAGLIEGYKSLRKIVASDLAPLSSDSGAMQPLRKGR
jgi:anaerobic magnesium-protoporphyrin IX monomethyl ester cyclase